MNLGKKYEKITTFATPATTNSQKQLLHHIANNGTEAAFVKWKRYAAFCQPASLDRSDTLMNRYSYVATYLNDNDAENVARCKRIYMIS